MREIFATLERIAPKNLSVLFQGETGTGKEEMARAIVARSARSTAPFVVIDVTSIPETLLDVVLFGQEKTATAEAAPGLLEATNGGTAFVDEVGMLPLRRRRSSCACSSVRSSCGPVGTRPIKVDVRVLAATSRDLRHEIENGRFREDLYFRLAQVRILAPPLRDRPEDIPVLCKKLLAESEMAPRCDRRRGDAPARGPSVAGQRSRAQERARARGRSRSGRGDPAL